MMDSLLFFLFQMLILRIKWHVILFVFQDFQITLMYKITSLETDDISIPNKYFNGTFVIRVNCRPDNSGIKVASFIIVAALPPIADEINTPIG